ncbi:MAG: SDR family oxidoreductase, partial [Pseudomonadota bacterium]
MSGTLSGKSVIVTGAANGVGLAIARRFVEEGAKVMLADADDEKLKDETASIKTSEERVQCFSCDLRERLSIANLMANTIESFDRVDVLVNASRQVTASDPLDPDCELFDAMMQQNVKNALRLSQIVARKMIKHAEERGDQGPAGSIVNITSTRSKLSMVLAIRLA